MSGKTTKKGLLVIEALEKFPKASKRSIGAYLHENYPALFTSVEAARKLVVQYTTESSNIKNIVEHQAEATRENPYGIPRSKGPIRKFVHLPDGIENVLVLSDIHFPNHDEKALENALKYGMDKKIDCIVLNGDILDNSPFSSHLGPPPLLSEVREWFEMVEEFLDMLIREFKVAIYWLEGNHDAWYRRYLMKAAPLLYHDSYYTMSARLKLREKNIAWLNEDEVLMAGNLPITHGHMIVKGFFSPVNPAKGVYNKIGSAMLIGHCHTTSEYSHGIFFNHRLMTTYSTGCLCTLAPSYDPYNNKHNLGFARIVIYEDKNYRVYNETIDPVTKKVL
jgi:predicted phosphodiesterase